MSPRPEGLDDELRSAEQDLVAARIGAYRVLTRLGAGGMGEVYEVEHAELGRRFALKVLRAELRHDSETRARFHREPRAMAQLVSEHVVGIVDCGELRDGTPYFVMERLYGSDLRRLLGEQGVLPVARVASLGVDACLGLACAHRAGLVHRDLKPENLFVTVRDDGRDLCKLLDFGIVKSARDNNTRPGAVLGTTRYMAPEQLGLDVPVSPQTDLFALGVILYECLAGRTPFEGDTVERVLFKIMSEPEVPILELRPEIPEGLANLVSRALSKKPEDRPISALQMAEALLPFTQPAERQRVTAWQLRVTDELGSNAARQLTPLVAGDFPTPSTPAQAPPATLQTPAELASQSVRSKRLPSLFMGATVGAVVAIPLTLLVRNYGSSSEQLPAGRPITPSAVLAPSTREQPSVSSVSAAPDAATASTVRSMPSTGDLPPVQNKRKAATKSPALAKSSPSNSPPAATFDPQNPYAP